MIRGGCCCCLGGTTTLQTLKIAPSISKPPLLRPHRHSLPILRALSSPALNSAVPVPTGEDKLKPAAVTPQWKAAIDFKWLRDNKDLVAANIRNRNSTADLDLVLDLYDQFLALQKIAGG